MTQEPKNDGGQAFPQPITVGPSGDVYSAYPGMTLRDWFAGQAMAAIIAKLDLGGVNPPTGARATGHSEASRAAIMGALARGAYHYADAMVEERNKSALEQQEAAS